MSLCTDSWIICFLPGKCKFDVAFCRCCVYFWNFPSVYLLLFPGYCCITFYYSVLGLSVKAHNCWMESGKSLIFQFQNPHFYLYYFFSLMSSAKVAIFKLNLLKISRYLLMSCASLSFVPTYQKMRGLTPHFNLIFRW